MECNLADIRIHICSSSPLQLQQWIMQRGSTVIAAACRDVVCRFPDRDCTSCSKRIDCHYHLLFSQQLADDPVALKQHQKPPLPFAFSFLPDAVCRLVIIGTAISGLEMLLQGFIACINQRQSDSITKITSATFSGTEVLLGSADAPLKHSDALALLSSYDITQRIDPSAETVSIQLLTPLRLVQQGLIHRQFSISLFTRTVMRRVSSLAYYYCGFEFDADFRELSKQTDLLDSLEENFTYTSAGIGGSGIYCGDCSALLPFLAVGAYVNVGKGAAYGSGHYRLE